MSPKRSPSAPSSMSTTSITIGLTSAMASACSITGTEFGIGQEDFRLAVIENIGDGFGFEAHVQGVEDSACHRHTMMRLQHRRRVGQHGGNRVAWLDAMFDQGGCQTARALAQSSIVSAVGSVDDGQPVRKHVRRPLEKAER